MKTWTHLVVDVDYRPADPHAEWYCERTEFAHEDLKPGMLLKYDDPGGLFSLIKVTDVEEKSVSFQYGEKFFQLEDGGSNAYLDKGGRDYTNFMLNAWLRFDENSDDGVNPEEDEPDEDDGRWDAYV